MTLDRFWGEGNIEGSLSQFSRMPRLFLNTKALPRANLVQNAVLVTQPFAVTPRMETVVEQAFPGTVAEIAPQ